MSKSNNNAAVIEVSGETITAEQEDAFNQATDQEVAETMVEMKSEQIDLSQLTDEQLAVELAKRLEVKQAAQATKYTGNKSQIIRAMAADGFTRGAIAKALGIRYQHVRNVLITPVKGGR